MRDFNGHTNFLRAGKGPEPVRKSADPYRCIVESVFVFLALGKDTSGVRAFGPIDTGEDGVCAGAVQVSTSRECPGPAKLERQPYTGARGANILRVVTARPSRRGAGPSQAIRCRETMALPARWTRHRYANGHSPIRPAQPTKRIGGYTWRLANTLGKQVYVPVRGWRTIDQYHDREVHVLLNELNRELRPYFKTGSILDAPRDLIPRLIADRIDALQALVPFDESPCGSRRPGMTSLASSRSASTRSPTPPHCGTCFAPPGSASSPT